MWADQEDRSFILYPASTPFRTITPEKGCHCWSATLLLHTSKAPNVLTSTWALQPLRHPPLVFCSVFVPCCHNLNGRDELKVPTELHPPESFTTSGTEYLTRMRKASITYYVQSKRMTWQKATDQFQIQGHRSWRSPKLPLICSSGAMQNPVYPHGYLRNKAKHYHRLGFHLPSQLHISLMTAKITGSA